MPEKLPKIKKGVEIILEGGRRPGEKVGELVADINSFSREISESMKAMSEDMRDDDKLLVEIKLSNIRRELMDLATEVEPEPKED